MLFTHQHLCHKEWTKSSSNRQLSGRIIDDSTLKSTLHLLQYNNVKSINDVFGPIIFTAASLSTLHNVRANFILNLNLLSDQIDASLYSAPIGRWALRLPSIRLNNVIVMFFFFKLRFYVCSALLIVAIITIATV